MDKKIVLSSSEFRNLKEAEEKINSWYKSGTDFNKKTKAYKIVEIYDLKLKFVKRK